MAEMAVLAAGATFIFGVIVFLVMLMRVAMAHIPVAAAREGQMEILVLRATPEQHPLVFLKHFPEAPVAMAVLVEP